MCGSKEGGVEAAAVAEPGVSAHDSCARARLQPMRPDSCADDLLAVDICGGQAATCAQHCHPACRSCRLYGVWAVHDLS